MAFASAPSSGVSDPEVIKLVDEVVADFVNPEFDPAVEGRNASGITIPGDAGDDEGRWRNIADDVRTAARDRLLARGITPPEGLTLTLRRNGATVTFYYGKPRPKQNPAHVGPAGSTGKAPVAESGDDA